ncbi:MAG: putative hydrolase of the superfamily [Frankiales bacterium]|jgi:putative hydrolase of the HAD superfamily|nr:putative hydrolase of the superfamily [Frankiales bacterium]
MTLEAVVFDWGGTLNPTHWVDVADLWRVSAEHLAPDRVDEVTAALAAAEAEWWVEAVAGRRSGTTADLLTEVAAATGLDISQAVHDLALEAHHGVWAPRTVAHPYAADVIRAIRARGLKTGLLSNTHWFREWHEGFLERDGLLDLLDVRVYTSDIAHLKPAPEAFNAVLEQLGVQGSDAVFVGDRQYDDIFGAARVGMRTVWMSNDATPEHDVQPDAVISTLPELVDVIDAWMRGTAQAST